MGKMKELFMKQNYPYGDIDLEREYLTDDVLAQEKSYNEFLKLWEEEEFRNPNLNTKIEIGHGKTREIHTEEPSVNQQVKVT
jgi:hypothetical protein